MDRGISMQEGPGVGEATFEGTCDRDHGGGRAAHTEAEVIGVGGGSQNLDSASIALHPKTCLIAGV